MECMLAEWGGEDQAARFIASKRLVGLRVKCSPSATLMTARMNHHARNLGCAAVESKMSHTTAKQIVIRKACSFLLVMMLHGGRIIGGEIRQQSAQTGSHVSTIPTCQAIGKIVIKIDCTYAASGAVGASEEQKAPQILLSHAVITFQPVHESHMRIELTFTNKGQVALTESRTVYVEFDGPSGRNYIRRPLPHVDLQKLIPGAMMTFNDQFLAPSLSPGRYLVWLWIPSLDAALKFDARHNFLLGDTEMADSTNGLNRIATVLVEKADCAERSDDH